MGRNGEIRKIVLAAWTATLTAAAYAQDIPTDDGGIAGLIGQWGMIAGIVIAVALTGTVIAIVVYRQRRPPEMEGIYIEPAVVGSRFEQLLAEIQGLTLRVQGGESKGYYRKIEQICRVFLERTGHKDARHMTDEEIRALISGGEFPQETSASLKAIFERCKQGAIHETAKLDFSAAELLRDLRQIIKEVERTSTHRA